MSFGLARLDVRDGATPPAAVPDAVSAGGTSLRAPWGSIRTVRDGFVVAMGGRTLRLRPGLIDERDEGDTYTIQPVAGDRPLRPQWGRARLVWTGPLVAAVARPFLIGRRVRGTVYLRIDAGSPLLRAVTVEGGKLAGRHRLRLVVPVEGGDRATADMAFGAVTRRRD